MNSLSQDDGNYYDCSQDVDTISNYGLWFASIADSIPMQAQKPWSSPSASFNPNDIQTFLRQQRPQRAIEQASWNQGIIIPEPQDASSQPSITTIDSGYHTLCPTYAPRHRSISGPTPLDIRTQERDGLRPRRPPPSVSTEPAIPTGHCSPPPHHTSRSKSLIPPCKQCGKYLKNNSEAHKHAQQHEKPYTCEEPSCKRSEGFATKNDLERHRKTVHHKVPRVGKTEGFICAACLESMPGQSIKFWPRRDNFKAHIKRKHPDQDQESLLDRSVTERPDNAISESGYGSAAPLSQYDATDVVDRPDLASPVDAADLAHTFQQNSCSFANDELAGVGAGSFNSSGPGGGSSMHAFDWSNVQYNESQPQLEMPLMADSMTTYHGTLGSDPRAATARSNIVDSDDGVKVQLLDYDHIPERGHLSILSSGDRPSGTSTDRSDQCDGDLRCPHCPKLKKRECDLKKHIKRHTRPYGCTFPDCSKRFGSRNDWKRHENSQHYQEELWRCSLACLDGQICGKVAYNLEQMRQHLEGARHATQLGSPQALSKLLDSMHIGRNGHDRFWCGFHQDVISTAGDLQAWEARQKHIGDHYDKQECSIEDWVCLEENKPKRLIAHGDKKRTRVRGRRDGGAATSELQEDSDLGEDGIPLAMPPRYLTTGPTYMPDPSGAIYPSSKRSYAQLFDDEEVDGQGGDVSLQIEW